MSGEAGRTKEQLQELAVNADVQNRAIGGEAQKGRNNNVGRARIFWTWRVICGSSRFNQDISNRQEVF